MGWRDQLRAASFRGVDFLYDSADGDFGRRHARHEYPGRDIPYMEDMGRKVRTHTIQAFVLEPDHLARARALIEACEKAGPGTLVHPYLGELHVVCTGCRQRLTTREGGMASFSLSFAEAGENKYPAGQVSTAFKVQRAVNDALIAVQSAFNKAFGVDRLPEFVAASAEDLLSGSLDQINQSFQLSGNAASEVASLITGIKTGKSTLVRDPATLAGQIAGLLQKAATGDPLDVYRSQLKVSDWGGALAAIPTATATRKVQAANQTAYVAMVRRTALIEAARASSKIQFSTYGDAVAARDTLTGRIDSELMSTTGEAFQQLRDLYGAVTQDITRRGAYLPRLVNHTPATTRPAIVVAHSLYGDDPQSLIARAAEISARNRLRHPGQAPGGDPLQVLTNVR